MVGGFFDPDRREAWPVATAELLVEVTPTLLSGMLNQPIILTNSNVSKLLTPGQKKRYGKPEINSYLPSVFWSTKVLPMK
jgi:hypothetical protein